MEDSNNVSRRTLLKGIGAGVVATTLGSTVIGSTSVSAQSNPTLDDQAAFYRFRIGTFDVTVIADGTLTLPAAVLGTNAPEGALAALLDASYLPTDVFIAPAHAMLVNMGEGLVLIDAGLGGVALPGFETDTGKLLPTLALLGIAPADVNAVVLTHAHPDHIGGLLDSEGNLNFPQATVYINETERDFWTNAPTDTDDGLANFFATLAQNTLGALAGNLQTFSDEAEILSGITAVPAPGHTPGHTAFLIESDDDRVLNLGDTTLHYVVGLEEPTWYTGLEVDPATAEASRLALLARASDERLKIFGYHFPFPGIGYAVRDESAENGADRWEFVVTG